MSKSLLQEYVKALVEKIRGNHKFDVRVLKTLKTESEIRSYLESCSLSLLGEGSSRDVYLLSSKKVIKVAKDERGRAQNLAEVQVESDPQFKNLVAQIFEHDNDGLWNISELVREVTEEEFENAVGVILDDFVFFIETTYDINHGKKLDRWTKKDFLAINHLKDNPFIQNVMSLMNHGKLTAWDLVLLEHWGITPGRKIVLLDYGLTDDVYKKHYNR